MRILAPIFLIFSAVLSFSAEFNIMEELKSLPTDMTALTKEKLDVNGNPCALIKLFSNFDKDLIFENRNHLEDAPNRGQGEYWIYMRGGARNLAIKKEGFVPLNYEFPFQIEQGKTYRMTIVGEVEQQAFGEIGVVIQTEPTDAKVFLDGEEKDKSIAIMTKIGSHKIRIERSGYVTIEKDIEVTASNPFYSFKMQKIQEVLVEIESDPVGAMLYINDIMIGKTPQPSFHVPGNYNLKLVMEGFEDINETISVGTDGFSKKYFLQDIMATLTVNTHEKAQVYINGSKAVNYKNVKLLPQFVTIKVEMRGANPIEQKIMLGKRENKTVEMYPEIATGSVQLIVKPLDATIELWEEGGVRYTGTRSQVFNDVPIGDYKLKVSREGYKTQTVDLRVTEGATERKQFDLAAGSDYGAQGELSQQQNYLTLNERKFFKFSFYNGIKNISIPRSEDYSAWGYMLGSNYFKTFSIDKSKEIILSSGLEFSFEFYEFNYSYYDTQFFYEITQYVLSFPQILEAGMSLGKNNSTTIGLLAGLSPYTYTTDYGLEFFHIILLDLNLGGKIEIQTSKLRYFVKLRYDRLIFDLKNSGSFESETSSSLNFIIGIQI